MTVSSSAERKVEFAFATPIVVLQVPEAEVINPLLRSEIMRRAESEPGILRSNVGGWHSDVDFFDWPLEEVRHLAESVRKSVSSMAAMVNDAQRVATNQILNGWANVCGSGDFHVPHTHPLYHWSGVYYVDTGKPADDQSLNGVLEFQDPRPGVEMTVHPGGPFGKTAKINPKNGMMVLFPSWLPHFVRPHTGDRPRISIAFNSLVKSLEILDGV